MEDSVDAIGIDSAKQFLQRVGSFDDLMATYCYPLSNVSGKTIGQPILSLKEACNG